MESSITTALNALDLGSALVTTARLIAIAAQAISFAVARAFLALAAEAENKMLPTIPKANTKVMQIGEKAMVIPKMNA